MTTAERLVGREAELAQVLAAVHRLGEGGAEVLVVSGEAGIGKTGLVGSMVEEATAAGATVFSSVAHPFERSRPFGVLADALGLRRRSADPQRAALGAMLAGEAPEQAAGDIQYRVVDEVVDLVETACAANPVLLVTEDVHCADAPSLLAVSSLVRRLPLAPLLVVVTLRASPMSAELAGLLDDLDAAGARTLDLAPLSRDEALILASGVLGATPGPGLGSMIAKAGGNPLWVNALIRSLSDEGRLRRSADTVETTATEIPASLADLVVRRLRALPPETLELLQLAAVLGDSVPVRDLAVLARRRPTEVVIGLGEAFEAQLLDVADDRVAFRHELVHDAIHHHTPASARRALHRDAAVALMAAGAEPLDVADHLVLGAEGGDVEAATWLQQAARGAAAQAPLVTVDLLQRAAALLPPGHPEAAPLSCELVMALLRAGKVPEASTLAEEVLAGPHPPEIETPVRLVLLGALALQNRATELIAVARAGLAGSDGLGPHEQVPMLAQQSWALTYTGDHRAGEETAAKALDLAQQVGDAALTVWALTALLVAVGRQGRYGEALAHARRAASVAAGSRDPGSLPLQPKLFLGLALFDCDLVSEARASYRQALDEEFASGWWLADTLTADAQASFVLGEWEDAVPALAAATLAAQEKGNPLLVSQCLAHRILVATATGDLAGARELAAGLPGEPEDEASGYNGGVVAAALGGLLAAEGDDAGAYDLLLGCWRAEAARGDRFYHRTLAPTLVRLALAHGDRATAAWVSSEVAVGAALSPEVASVHAVDLRCRGLVHDDAELLLEAVAVVRGTPLVLEHAGTCVDAAAVLLDRGRPDEAASLLAEALQRYEQAGAGGWAGDVRARLRALGVQPGSRGGRSRPTVGWESLTSTERAVSLLVAEGLTNGAVARRLYVSPHTVNTHLRHVFAKLGVSNRVQLAGVVHRAIE